MPDRVDYFEIGSTDPATSKAFYESVFDWVVEPPSQPAGYSMVDEGRGGLWDSDDAGATNWAIFYVHVENVRSTVERAEAAGATVVVPVIDNGEIEFAHLADPMGNRFGVWAPHAAEPPA